MPTSQDIVQKLWALCHVLRDDGITYQDYISELTWLIFLKMAQETGTEGSLPEGYRWADLQAKKETDQLSFYKELLGFLGSRSSSLVQEIFSGASTSLRHSRTLAKLVAEVDTLDWYSARREGLGDMYEGLLEKNASEKKSGAGQYFTPRALIDCIVDLVKPAAGEIVQDPAVGTGGFIIAADRYIKEQTNNLKTLSAKHRLFQRRRAFFGVELVPGTHRLCLMNALLHGIEGTIFLGDSLSLDASLLPKADVVLTNPPFGSKKGGGLPMRTDFFPTNNKQLAFLQYAYVSLKPGGRAAIILPDNVLFDNGVGTRIRIDLMDKCNLHTILRLPSGIFYAQGVKTNVLFFQRQKSSLQKTKRVWVYDLRTNIPSFGRRTQLERAHFAGFESAFGPDPFGNSHREDQGESGRFRSFSREQIENRGNSLDLTWLREDISPGNAREPEDLLTGIMQNLRIAMEEIEEVAEALEVEGTLA